MGTNVVGTVSPVEANPRYLIMNCAFMGWDRVFVEIAEALCFTLIDMGYPAKIVSIGFFDPHARYILLGVNNLITEELVQPLLLRQDTVIFNLEQLFHNARWVSQPYLMFLREHEVWDYSAQNIQYLRTQGVNNIRHVPISFHPCYVAAEQRIRFNTDCIRGIQESKENMDVLFIGQMKECQRRQKILDDLKANGLRVEILTGVYGAERNAYYTKCKVLINIHFFPESQVFESVRVSHAVVNGCFVISENSVDVPNWARGPGILFVAYDNLVSTVLQMYRDPNRRVMARAAAERFIKDTSYESVLQGFVSGKVPRSLRNDPKKWAASYVAFADDRWIAKSVKSIYPYVDGIIFLIGYCSFHGEYFSNQEFVRTLQNLPDPEGKIIGIYRKFWKDEATTRNAGLHILNDLGYKYALTVDADEIYDAKDIQQIQSVLEKNEHVDNVYISNVVTYWKSEHFRIDPQDDNMFVHVAMKLSGSTYYVKNRVTTERSIVVARGARMHHMSYAHDDIEIQRKLNCFSHREEICADWIPRVWNRWNENQMLNNLHPTHPSRFRMAIPVPDNELPEVFSSE